MQLDLSNPIILGALVGGVILIALFWVILVGVKAANRSAAMMEPLAHNLGGLEARVQSLSDGQQQLSGGLAQVVDLQSKTQAQMLQAMERRLEEVQKGMSETLHGTSTRTARSLGELQQKLEQIDRAQAKIEKLSGDVLGLQDILSNKQTRGAFGEIQLNDIVSKALPSDSYAFQATLSNGKRADCLIHLPKPPGPIVIDSKFPLEAYEALRAAKTAQETQDAARAFRTSVRGHIKAISERYILEGETADGALMFLPFASACIGH